MEPDTPSSTDFADPDALDEAFLALRNRTRRFALYFLLEHESATVAELADVVTGWIHATDDGIVEPQCRRRHYLDLLHTHVPRLVELDLVDLDDETETLSLAPCPDSVREVVAKACAAETGS